MYSVIITDNSLTLILFDSKRDYAILCKFMNIEWVSDIEVMSDYSNYSIKDRPNDVSDSYCKFNMVTFLIESPSSMLNGSGI